MCRHRMLCKLCQLCENIQNATDKIKTTINRLIVLFIAHRDHAVLLSFMVLIMID